MPAERLAAKLWRSSTVQISSGRMLAAAAWSVMKQVYPARQLTSGPDEMRVNQTIAARSFLFLALLTGLLGLACFGTGESRAAGGVRQPIAIQLFLDRQIDESAAPFVLVACWALVGL